MLSEQHYSPCPEQPSGHSYLDINNQDPTNQDSKNQADHYRCPNNRIYALMLHTNRYAFKGCSRLAADAGVSKSSVSRLLNGRSNPSCRLLTAVFKAIEKQLKKEKRIKKSLPLRELISLDDSYPTSSVCRLIGCDGCLLSEPDTSEAR